MLRLYPVVDHVADRLAATQAADGAAGDQRSSRIRDLVDLVVLARTQSVDGVELSRAVRAEWAHRGLGGAPVFDPPAMWASKNSSLARAVQACGDTVRFGTP